jgi:hypothetical protein
MEQFVRFSSPLDEGVEKRRKRSMAELNQELFEQTSALDASCRNYDAGEVWEHKRIANSIYTLVFDKARSKSVISQLGKKNELKFVSTGDLNESLLSKKVTHSTSPLLVMRMGERGKLVNLPSLNSRKCSLVGFDEWWEREVIWFRKIRGGAPLVLCRKTLILSVTDQDGGRHYDETLSDEAYRAIKYLSSFTDSKSGEPALLHEGPTMVRQIAHEVLQTLADLDKPS